MQNLTSSPNYFILHYSYYAKIAGGWYMNTARLSSKGQLIIPKPIRQMHGWDAGQELEVIDTDQGVFLKTKSPFPETTLDEVAGSLACRGKARSLVEMDQAIAMGVKDHS
jgi:AbrB family looped-hinge helix DNA binding protein